jgi:hypothetical protein
VRHWRLRPRFLREAHRWRVLAIGAALTALTAVPAVLQLA